MLVVSEKWGLLSPSDSSLAEDGPPPPLSIPPCSQDCPVACLSLFLQTAFLPRRHLLQGERHCNDL